MQQMRTISIDDPGVCQSVGPISLSVCYVLGFTRLRAVQIHNTAERIEALRLLLLEMEAFVGPKEHCIRL